MRVIRGCLTQALAVSLHRYLTTRSKLGNVILLNTTALNGNMQSLRTPDSIESAWLFGRHAKDSLPEVNVVSNQSLGTFLGIKS